MVTEAYKAEIKCTKLDIYVFIIKMLKNWNHSNIVWTFKRKIIFPFYYRWVCTSGSPNDLDITDEISANVLEDIINEGGKILDINPHVTINNTRSLEYRRKLNSVYEVIFELRDSEYPSPKRIKLRDPNYQNL